MGDKTTLIRIYVSDYEVFNTYLSLMQIREGRRLSFAEVIAELVRLVVKPKCDELLKDIKGE